jgi:small subunit ribosomal protein S6
MAEHEARGYELVYIIQPEVSDQALTEFNERMTQVIINQGGTMQATELWGKRALAYPIENQFQGHYVLHRFLLPPQGSDEIERLLRYSEDVLRYMMVRTDE